MHKFLLVDDESDILELLAELLKDEFTCEIEKASNGLDAFLLSMKNEYDFIITDHKMPFMTGAAFTVAVRTKENFNKNTPILVLSAFIDDYMKDNLSVENVRMMEKPPNFEQLTELIVDVLISPKD